MKKLTNKKLSLSKQTIRSIRHLELGDAVGGALNPGSVGCSQTNHCGTGSVLSACGCTHDFE